MKKYYFTSFCFILAVGFSMENLPAQDIHVAQYNQMPMAVNPAFTGLFDGRIRASVLYRNQWQDNIAPYNTLGVSVDAPLYNNRHGSCVALGLQYTRDRIGDNVFINGNGALSLAYHKFFGLNHFAKDKKGSDLGLGMQVMTGQTQMDVSKFFFEDNKYFNYFYFRLGWPSPYLIISPAYTSVNAGICYTRFAGPDLSYTIGLAGYNLNQPGSPGNKRDIFISGIEKSYTGVVNASWNVSRRVSVRPSVYYVSKDYFNAAIGGCQADYRFIDKTGSAEHRPLVFAGIWYRSGKSQTITPCVEYSGFRLGLGYELNSMGIANGNGGMEVSLKYILPPRVQPATK